MAFFSGVNHALYLTGQSPRFFFLQSELGPPPHTPSPASEFPPFWLRGVHCTVHTLLRKLGGGVPIPFRRGVRHCGTLGIYVLCALHAQTVPPSQLHTNPCPSSATPLKVGVLSVLSFTCKARCQSFKRCSYVSCSCYFMHMLCSLPSTIPFVIDLLHNRSSSQQTHLGAATQRWILQQLYH
jgi:hypothetical protein